MNLFSSDFKRIAQIEYYLCKKAIKEGLDTNFIVRFRKRGKCLQIYYAIKNRVKYIDYYLNIDGELTKEWCDNFVKRLIEDRDRVIEKKLFRKEMNKIINKRTIKGDYL